MRKNIALQKQTTDGRENLKKDKEHPLQERLKVKLFKRQSKLQKIRRVYL
jgi:hypothetical protein